MTQHASRSPRAHGHGEAHEMRGGAVITGMGCVCAAGLSSAAAFAALEQGQRHFCLGSLLGRHALRQACLPEDALAAMGVVAGTTAGSDWADYLAANLALALLPHSHGPCRRGYGYFHAGLCQRPRHLHPGQ